MDTSKEETDARDEEEVEEERTESEEESETRMDENEESDDSDNEVDPDEAEVNALQARLRENPYDYASHVALISKLQEMGNERYRLQDARQNMSNMYPLSPELWLSWIRDEMKLATTAEEKMEVTQLCERAIEDYVCKLRLFKEHEFKIRGLTDHDTSCCVLLAVEIWLEYLQFSIGNMGLEKDAASYVRKLFERALTVVGLHVTKGAIIWEAFREFETILLALVRS